MPGIHTEVLEVWAESRTWEEFEGQLLEKYGLDDALRLSKRDFMEWVESPDKGRNTSVLLREFEERFARLSALDRTVLDTSRVLLFVKSVDERDREQVGLLLGNRRRADSRLGRGKKSLRPFRQTAGMG